MTHLFTSPEVADGLLEGWKELTCCYSNWVAAADKPPQLRVLF